MSPLTPIVAAAIVDSLERPTRFLAAARAYPATLQGQYELPGGKIDDGESPEEALVREISEELSVHIHLGSPIVQHDGSWWPLANGRTMGVWLAQSTQGTPTLGESHLLLEWLPLTPDALQRPWIPADLPIIEALIEHANPQSSPNEPQAKQL